jgi:hypothetical protein
VRRTVISIDSEMTGMRIELPLLPQLKETRVRRVTSPSSSPGAARPGIRARWEPNFAAGVFGKSARGVRKGAATRAAENGATERELAAIFGLVRGADGDPLHQKRQPQQTCGGGHRQARPWRDRR